MSPKFEDNGDPLFFLICLLFNIDNVFLSTLSIFLIKSHILILLFSFVKLLFSKDSILLTSFPSSFCILLFVFPI